MSELSLDTAAFECFPPAPSILICVFVQATLQRAIIPQS